MRVARRLNICRLLGGLVGVALAAGSVSVAQAAVPVLKAMAAPSTAHAGDVVSLKLTVHNASRRAVRHVVVLVTLVPADGTASRRVHARSISRLRARTQTTTRVAATIPATGAPATFTLRICIGKRCLDTHPITLLAGDAYDRITSALAAGRLRIGTAALYEMQAAANSPHVPAAYRDTAPGGPDTPGLIALDNWGRLSAKDRAALVPYFLPPTYAQSVWAPRRRKARKRASSSSATVADAPSVGIDYPLNVLNCRHRSLVPSGDWGVTASSGDVVIHSQDRGDFGLVRYLAGQVPTIWTTLVTSDRFPAPASDASCDPHDDGQLDVYLVPKAELPEDNWGVAIPLSCGVNGPGYIVMTDDRPAKDTASILAHEFFHIEQDAAGVQCFKPQAWREGAAEWAMDEVYPNNPLTHEWGFWFAQPFEAMKTLSYNAWPFWYWLRRQYGAAKIATLFSTLRSLGFDQAVREAPGVDFVDAFRDFAMYLWNQAPIGQGGDFPPQSFAQWDDFDAKTTTLDPDLTLGGAKGGPTPDTYRTAVTLPPLSIRYLEFNVAAPIKQVTIDNGFAQGADVGVDLYAVTSGVPKRIDLTTEGEKTFCEDNPGEDISHGIIAVSNAGETARTANVDVVVGTRCKPSLQFDGTSKCDAICAGAGTQDWEWAGSADLTIDPHSPATAPLYDVVGGSVTVEVHGSTPDGCTFSGSATVPLNAGHDTVSLDLTDQPPAYQFSVILFNEPITATYSGCDDPPPPVVLPIESVPFAQTSTPLDRDPSAITLEHTNDTPEAPGQPALHQHWKIGL